MQDVKCECGHANPVGTVLCESCGMPLQDEQGESGLLEMRYEGVARRSQTYNRTLIDRIWNFFSSVKIAVWMIALTLIASIIGTILPQEEYIPVNQPPEVFYKDAYGVIGQVYYWLGWHNLYSSWWYVLLLMMIGTSLVICSLDRVVPLYKALKKQRAKRHKSFLLRQRISGVYEIRPQEKEKILADAEAALEKRKFHVLKEGNSLVGEKGRISRWGPYINHIGLIIFLMGVLMRLIPGFYLNEFVWVREGEIEKVPGTDYFVENESFTIHFYEKEELPEGVDSLVKSYETRAVLYEEKNPSLPGAEQELVKVKEDLIRLNHPLEYKDLRLYQSGQQVNQLEALNLTLVDKQTGEELGDFKLGLFDTKRDIQLNEEIRIKVVEYYPDLEFTEDDQPTSKSSWPNNPAFIIEITGPKTPEGEKTWIFLGSTLNEKGEQRTYDVAFSMPDLTDLSGLRARKDKSMPVVYAGAFIFLIGVVIGFYWQHRRIWVQQEDDRTLLIAAYTNKNWYGMKKDVASILSEANIELDVEKMVQGGK